MISYKCNSIYREHRWEVSYNTSVVKFRVIESKSRVIVKNVELSL